MHRGFGDSRLTLVDLSESPDYLLVKQIVILIYIFFLILFKSEIKGLFPHHGCSLHDNRTFKTDAFYSTLQQQRTTAAYELFPVEAKP